MALKFGKMHLIESVDQIGTDLKVGVSINRNREHFFIAGKDEDGDYSIILKIYSCDVGIAAGDLIGCVASLPGIPDGDRVFSDIEECYLNIKRWLPSEDKDTDRAKLVNSVLLMSSEVLFGNASGNVYEKNLLALPLFVEVMSGCIKDGTCYNFKKSDKILSSLKKYRKPLEVFAEDVMLYDKNTDPRSALTQIELERIPSFSYSGYTTLLFNDQESDMRLTEAFIPDTFDDLISYLVNRYVLGYHFYCCANCGRYFGFSTDTKNRSCTRYIESAHYLKDIGRQCYEVGRLRSHVRSLYSDDTQILYQRNYKATFARKKKGHITEEHFAKWSEKARDMRDRCLEGDISYDELEQWFRDNYLRE